MDVVLAAVSGERPRLANFSLAARWRFAPIEILYGVDQRTPNSFCHSLSLG